MKQRLIAWMFCLACALAPLTALAQDQEEVALKEARLEGFPNPVSVEGGSTALLWLLTGFLGVVAFAALFKNARRTHLD